jgi:GTP-binding protein EngB required for normal cell division
MEEYLAHHLRLDGVVTLVDAKHATRHIEEEKPDGVVNEAVEQIAYADRIILNKIDLVTESEVNTLIKRIQVFCKADVCVSSILDALAISCLSSYMVPHCFVEVDVSLLHLYCERSCSC